MFPVWVPSPGGSLFLKPEKSAGKGHLLRRPGDKPSGSSLQPLCTYHSQGMTWRPFWWSYVCVHICSIYIYKYKYLFTDGLFLIWKKKMFYRNRKWERLRRFLLSHSTISLSRYIAPWWLWDLGKLKYLFIIERLKIPILDHQNNHEIYAGQDLFSHLPDKETGSQKT